MTENKTYSYLLERYRATGWPYYSLVYTQFKVGDGFAADVKELIKKEMIQMVEGLNGDLIEIINFEKWNLK